MLRFGAVFMPPGKSVILIYAPRQVYTYGVRRCAVAPFWREFCLAHHVLESMFDLPHPPLSVPRLFCPLAKTIVRAPFRRGREEIGSVFAVGNTMFLVISP